MNSYDAVPYSSHPFPQATPARLATIASLFGLSPAPIDRCRFLDIGCASGGHILPLAAQFPNSTFVGIDLSQRQIADALKTRDRLNLANASFLHQDLATFSDPLPFDYIAAHGVYSWIPPATQQKLLALIKSHLAPAGVAFVSYNTFPGWHFRIIVRDLMNLRASHVKDPAEKLTAALAALDMLIASIPPENNPYALYLAKERAHLSDKPPDYLLHEYLEDHNQPLYFRDFMRSASANRLLFLGEADFHNLFPIRGLNADPEPYIQQAAPDLLETEQYRDFLRCRLFRQTLLVHDNLRPDRVLPAERVRNLHISSNLQPDTPNAAPDSDEQMTFSRADINTHSRDPLYKAAMLHLARIYPASIPFDPLYRTACLLLNRQPAPDPFATSDGRSLAINFIKGYAGGATDLSLFPVHAAADVPEKPAAHPFARDQALHSLFITTLRHEHFTPSDFDRALIPLLDGSRDFAALHREVSALADAGHLTIHDKDIPVTDPVHRAAQITQALTQTLTTLRRRAILLPPDPTPRPPQP